MRKLNVAFCIPNMIIGGVETVLITLLEQLLKHDDLNIQLVTHAKISEPLYSNWLDQHPEIDVYVCYPLLVFFEKLKKYCSFPPLKQIRKLIFSLYKKYRRLIIKRTLAAKGFDIFIDFKGAEFYKELRCVNGVKILWLHTALSYLESNGTMAKIGLYDKIIGITNDFCNDVRHKYPKFADRVVQVYNPIDTCELKRKLATAQKIPNDTQYFCHVSRLDGKQKDIETVLHAFDKFYNQNNCPEIKMFIIGTGPQEKYLRTVAKNLSSATNIVFLGALRNPYGYMCGALANILSSNYEGFGMTLIESAALGRLCISSNCKYGPREILLDGQGGLLFAVGNADELAKHMTDVFNKRCNIDEMTKNAKNGLTRFCAESIADQVKTLILGVQNKQ